MTQDDVAPHLIRYREEIKIAMLLKNNRIVLTLGDYRRMDARTSDIIDEILIAENACGE